VGLLVQTDCVQTDRLAVVGLDKGLGDAEEEGLGVLGVGPAFPEGEIGFLGEVVGVLGRQALAADEASEPGLGVAHEAFEARLGLDVVGRS